MNDLKTAAQQALDSINELFAAEQSEGGERGGHIRTPATREHLVRVAQARKALHESCGALRAALEQQDEPVAYTTGHCENHKQKGGCQLHNLQCGWPDCDRKPTTVPPQQAEPVEPVAGRAFLERILTAMEGVIDVADRKTDEFDALRSCVIDLTLMLHTAPPQRKPLTEEEIYRATGHCGVSKYTAINITRAVELAHGIKEN